jgi:transcription initiation factor TFIIB
MSLADRWHPIADQACCDHPTLITNQEGLNVCSNCGVVHSQDIVDNGRRAYSADEIQARAINEPRWRPFGPRTLIGAPDHDTFGTRINVRSKRMFSRLSKIQNSLISSAERNYWEARPKQKKIIQQLYLPSHVVDTSWRIYQRIVELRLTLGRSISAFTAASIYCAARAHDCPVLIEEVAEAAQISMRMLHKTLGIVVQTVLPDLGFKLQVINPETLITKFGNILDTPMEVQSLAINILKYAHKRGLFSQGKDPRGLAAASLYMAAKKRGYRFTQQEISEAAHITMVTLRKRVKSLLKYLPNYQL